MGVPESTSSTVPIVEEIVLDDSGDVILVVGTYRIRVSSKVLSLASPFFAAMFGPRFREGYELQKSTTDQPMTVAFPEDNGEAMLTLCRIPHFDSCGIKKDRPTLAALDRMATTSDKYDCFDSICFVTTN